MDTPRFWHKLVYRDAQFTTLKRQVFDIVGFEPARFTVLGGVRTASKTKINKWEEKVAQLGAKAQ